MGELHHECGVAAVYHMPAANASNLLPLANRPDSASRLIPRMLLDMQNRGQLAAGISSYQADRKWLLKTHKKLGTVSEVFQLVRQDDFRKLMEAYNGNAAIGHVRYATCGGEDERLAQPFEREHGRKTRWFSVAFNGQLANYNDLKHDLLESGDYHLRLDTDTEILMHCLSRELQAERDPSAIDWVGVFGRVARHFDGAYTIVLLSATGDMIVARDPLGFRPLCYARRGSMFAAASESVPLANLGFEEIRSLPPGHLAIVNAHGVRIAPFLEATTDRRAHCFFEWVYFANVASTLDDRSVYLTRSDLGLELAKQEDRHWDPAEAIVVPVPDTAKAAADAMAFGLGLRSVEGLMRNRYMGRTFIEGARGRVEKARLKYTPLPEVLSDKQVLLVEDSIVRSTTMRALIDEIRVRGRAREIHIRVACPPIIAPCYYGIDMSKRHELFAAQPQFRESGSGPLTRRTEQRMAEELGANSLRYLPVDALARAVGLSEDQLCQACVTARYPTLAGTQLYAKDEPRAEIYPSLIDSDSDDEIEPRAYEAS